MRSVGHKRLPEFIEEDYISAVETAVSNSLYPRYFVEISRISQDEENDLGYDGVLTTLVPFFIQFKRSTFHTPKFQGKTAKDRSKCGYTNKSGFFSFSLHRDKNSKKFDQHNALFNLSKHAMAAYSAPLFYKRQELSRLKQYNGNHPWQFQEVVIVDIDDPARPINFGNVRVLRDSITFPPHGLVNDHVPSHEYTYTRNGDICFHSDPFPVDVKTSTFLELIKDMIQSAINIKDQKTGDGRFIFEVLPEILNMNWRSRNFRGILKSYLYELDFLPYNWNGNLFDFVFEDMSVRDRLLLSEEVLKSEFGIIQYTLRIRRA